MSAIYSLVHSTLQAGYLSLETENQLRKLSASCLDADDLDAVTVLKQALTFGHVKRQADELKWANRSRLRTLQAA
jgi:hypothetical protein